MTKAKKKPSQETVREVFALAKEFGWTHLNAQELRLIKTLRETTWHGRDLVSEIATAMQRAHPWLWDSKGTDFKSNTATPSRANDGRFISATKEK